MSKAFVLLVLGLALFTSVLVRGDRVVKGDCGPNVKWSLHISEKGQNRLTILSNGNGKMTALCDISDSYKQQLNRMVIASNMSELMEHGFEGYVYVQKVEFSVGLDIKNYLFSGCTKLNSVTFNSSTKKIGDSAFEGCPKLISINLPDSLTFIGKNAFKGCTTLYRVGVNQNLQEIGESAFQDCVALKSFSIPASVTTIKSKTFYNCSNLSSISIPDSVSAIDTSAFGLCTSLVQFNVSSSNELFSEVAGVLFNRSFSKLLAFPCGKSADYTIPESVTTLGQNSFFGCGILKSLVIPESVRSIEDSSIAWCDSLESVTYLGLNDPCVSFNSVHDNGALNTISVKHNFEQETMCGINVTKDLFDVICDAVDKGNWSIKQGTTVMDGHVYGETDILIDFIQHHHAINISGNEVLEFNESTPVYGNLDLKACYIISCEGVNCGRWYAMNESSLANGKIYGETDVLRGILQRCHAISVSENGVMEFNESFVVKNDLELTLSHTVECDSIPNETLYVKDGSSLQTGVVYGETDVLRNMLRDYQAVAVSDGEVILGFHETTPVHNDLKLKLCHTVKCDSVANGVWYVNNGSSLEDGVWFGDTLREILKNYHLVDRYNETKEYTSDSVIHEDIVVVPMCLVRVNGVIQGEYLESNGTSLCDAIPSLCDEANGYVVGNQETKMTVDVGMTIMSNLDLIVMNSSNAVLVEFEKGVQYGDVASFFDTANELVKFNSEDIVFEFVKGENGAIHVLMYVTDSDAADNLAVSFNNYLREKCNQ